MYYRNRMIFAKVALLILAVGVNSIHAAAGRASFDQDVAAVSGTVVDAAGATIAGVKINLVSDARGFIRETSTNEEGQFYIPFVPPGTYTLMAEFRGFATVTITGVIAQSGMNSNLEIALQPRARHETITVRAKNSQIDFSDGTIRYSITPQQVKSHPVLAGGTGRTLLDASSLFLPGLSPGLELGVRGESIIVNGSRPVSNVFLIDGGDNNDYELSKALAPLPNPDALHEVIVVTHNFKADLGGGTGGVFNLVTKSGSNQLHGNVRYFGSNESLNARSFFDPGNSRDRVKTIGAQLGGPVFLPRFYNGKDRTHFFFDYERSSTAFERFIRIPVMSNKHRLGDFSDLPPFDPDFPFGSRQPVDPLTGRAFPDGKVPLERFDPIARFYLNQVIPAPNSSDGLSFDRFGSESTRNNQMTVRLDHRLGNSDDLAATYYYNQFRSEDPSEELPIGSHVSIGSNHNLVIRETRAISGATVNQLSGTAALFVQHGREFAPGFAGIHPRDAGFTGIHPQTDRMISLPMLDFFDVVAPLLSNRISVQGQGLRTPLDNTKLTLAVRDDLTHRVGKHSITGGTGWRFFLFDRHRRGISIFLFSDGNALGTRLSASDFLIGRPATYLQSTGVSQYQRQHSYSIYGMDEWRVRPNLTFSFGLRYEITPPAVDKRDQISVFRPGQRSQRFPDAPLGQLFIGDPDPIFGEVPRGGYATDKNNFAPRIGVAYSPEPKRGWMQKVFGERRTSIRAGFGVTYDRSYGLPFSEFSFYQPFVWSVALPATLIESFANPFGSRPNPFPAPLDGRAFRDFGSLHAYDPTYRTPYTYHYNLTVQRELPASILMELAYVGTNSFKTERQRDLDLVEGIPTRQFTYITSQESSGRARYDSLQARLSRRFRTGVWFDGSYTFGKSLDNSSAPYSPIISSPILLTPDVSPTNADPMKWARSAFDRRHNFAIGYGWRIPALAIHESVDFLLRGWELGGITQLRTGMPIDLFDTSFDFESISRTPDLVGPHRKLNPRQIRTFVRTDRLFEDTTNITGNFFFDPTAFREIDRNREGTLGRNVIDGPGINLTSLSIAKRSRLFESHELEFRADISNLFNHANFGKPETQIHSPFFGQVLSALPGRRIQLSLRYRF